jgi:hypothetical protein
MNELTNTESRNHPRWRLLTTVSAAALLPLLYSAADAADRDADRPTVWIELGGQLDRTSANSDPFAPAFIGKSPDSPAFAPISPIEAQRSPRYSKGLEGKIIFQPEDSNWLFTAALRYGRSNGTKHIHEQTAGINLPSSAIVHGFPTFDPPAVKNFADTNAKNSASQTIVDFQVGRDVGVGMFGRGGSSSVNVGVRYAQFSSKTDVDLKARPNIFIGTTFSQGTQPFAEPGIKYWYAYSAHTHSERNFHGIGPSLSWNASAAIAGNTEDGEITFDWGVNAAVLFGRQKAETSHQSTANRFYLLHNPQYGLIYAHHPNAISRSRSVTVPNVGGFAGISMRYSVAKFSLGYRGDFFFGAMDTGIDTRHTSDQTFHGPFATISIGLGG